MNSDVGITKKFAFSERWNLAFVAEIFNVGNNVHHARPGYTVQTSTTSANNFQNGGFMILNDIANTGRDGLDQRTLRLSMKLTF